MHIAGEMQIDIFHRQNLCITAARSAALDPKYRTQGGLTQGYNGIFSYFGHSLSQTCRRGCLPFSCRCRVDRCHKYQLSVRPLFQTGKDGFIQFGLIFPVKFQFVFLNTQVPCNIGNWPEFSALGNLNISQHRIFTPFRPCWGTAK